MTESTAFTPLSLAELFALDPPEPDWIASSLFPAGSPTLFADRVRVFGINLRGGTRAGAGRAVDERCS